MESLCYLLVAASTPPLKFGLINTFLGRTGVAAITGTAGTAPKVGVSKPSSGGGCGCNAPSGPGGPLRGGISGPLPGPTIGPKGGPPGGGAPGPPGRYIGPPGPIRGPPRIGSNGGRSPGRIIPGRIMGSKGGPRGGNGGRPPMGKFIRLLRKLFISPGKPGRGGKRGLMPPRNGPGPKPGPPGPPGCGSIPGGGKC